MLRPFFPTRMANRRLPFGLPDLVVILGTFALLYLVARVGAGMFDSFHPPEVVPQISLDPHNLPAYAARSTLRMFLALGGSVLFTFVYGYIAAHSRRAERVLIPLLDILQSVPVLGFLSIVLLGFIALFPGNLFGLECAAIFAIFTSQAWNMTFSFYQSLRTIPHELDEAIALYRLPRWQRFTRLEVPNAMIGLVWNAMMSFGGAWFFLAASEAISVLNQSYTLPGIGSYLAVAVTTEDFGALGWALLTMAVVIVIIDQFFWRPLIAWSDKFKLEQSRGAEVPDSWLLELLRKARIPGMVSNALAPLGNRIDALLSRLFGRPSEPSGAMPNPHADRLYNLLLVLLTLALVGWGVWFVVHEVGLYETGLAVLLGFATLIRVLVLTVVSSLIWVPIGVAIGFNPRLARFVQPVVQFLSSFPANFLFPFATLFFLQTGLSLNIGSMLLMTLGTQWYILFNVIAGASSIPTDLREMASNLGLRGWQRWRALILPGIFSSWVTGGITAAGGAWNASIVAEVVSWGTTTLTAFGLGAYIADATQHGDWPRIVLGVGVMSLYVVLVNRLVWRRLYALAETKYQLM